MDAHTRDDRAGLADSLSDHHRDVRIRLRADVSRQDWLEGRPAVRRQSRVESDLHADPIRDAEPASRLSGHFGRLGNDHLDVRGDLEALSLDQSGPDSVFRLGVVGNRAATVDHGDELGERMNAIDLIHRLHQHRAWVNENLLSATNSLTDEQLHQQFPIGQGSIWKSLLHLYAAEFVWLEALQGDDNPLVQGDLPGKIPGNQLGEGGIASLDDLREKWGVLLQRWNNYLADLSPMLLDESVFKVAFGTGKRVATRRFDVLLHVCTHAQYTTAQVVNILRQVGVEKLPETMLISLARKEMQP